MYSFWRGIQTMNNPWTHGQSAYAYTLQGQAPYAYAAAACVTTSSSNETYDESDDDDTMPWQRHDWIPRTKSGAQKTPNMVRNELQRYIDQCKANGTSNKTRIIERIGVNSNSFNKFMNPGTYKDTWSATQNGTYWAGAKLLARLEHEKEQAKLNAKIEAINDKYEAKIAKINAKNEAKMATVSSKRDIIDLTDDSMSTSNKKAKTNGEFDSSTAPRKKTSAELKEDAEELIQRIKATYIGDYYVVYDSCPEIVTKIKTFLETPGTTKVMLCSALGNINNNSLGQFLSGKKQDQCGNITYRAAYVFFEKLRILEGKSKSTKRLSNEAINPNGFSLSKERPPRMLGKSYRW